MRRLRAGTIALGLGLCGALSFVPSAMAGTGSIEGTATDATAGHDPIMGAQVCFYEPGGATEEGCANTDAGGHYVLAGLNPGSYTITFRAPAGQNYVTQYYDGAQAFVDADPVAVAGAPVQGIDAEMQEGGTITGAAIEAGSEHPIRGLSVCASAHGGEYSGCTVTAADGKYAITGLPADPKYQVEFFAGKELNYLTQYYDGKEGLGNWDPVPVLVGEITDEVDAVMKPGAQIAGKVTEDGTAAPLGGIEVCALDPANNPRAQEFEQCALTDAAGDYTIRSLRSGTFVVAFSRERGLGGDGYLTQYYDGVSSAAQATAIAVAPPETRAGINAHLVGMFPGPRVIVTLIERGTPAPKKCRKGLRRKTVRGRQRCVRRHRRHHRHSHDHGDHRLAANR
jgi:hypothetical protein